MSITTLTPVEPVSGPGPAVAPAREPERPGLADVVDLVGRRERRRAAQPGVTPSTAPSTASSAPPEGTTGQDLAEAGAASAEYAAVTACGVGLAGVLLKLLSSDFGQNLLKTLIEFFLKMVGIG